MRRILSNNVRIVSVTDNNLSGTLNGTQFSKSGTVRIGKDSLLKKLRRQKK